MGTNITDPVWNQAGLNKKIYKSNEITVDLFISILDYIIALPEAEGKEL